MGKFVTGNIVVIPFPYTDLSQFKKRPGLIIKNLGNYDYLLVMITSQPYDNAYCLELKNSDFIEGKLPLISYVRCNRIFEANENIIIKKVATLSPVFTKNVIDTLIDFLKK
jgi:mRNA interferase MazF